MTDSAEVHIELLLGFTLPVLLLEEAKDAVILSIWNWNFLLIEFK